MGGDGIRELFASDDPVAQIPCDKGLCGIRLALIGQTVERRAERHACFQKVAEFRCEQQDFRRLHAQGRIADLEIPDRLFFGCFLPFGFEY